MEQMLFLVPVVGLLGLLFAVILRQQIVKEDPGTDRMREIHRFWNTELDYSRMFPCGKRFFHHGRLSGHERRYPRQQPYR